MASATEANSMFTGLQYYKCGQISDKAAKILDDAGAKCNSYMSELVKMAISDTTEDIDEYSEITDIYDIPVVSCKWVTLSHEVGRLLPTKAFPPNQNPNKLFNGVVVTSSHFDRADTNALWAMVTYHGGQTHAKVSSSTTHLVCKDDKGSKFALCLEKDIMIVTPDWVTECIKQKKMLAVKEFHPKYLTSSSQALRDRLRTPPPREPVAENMMVTPQRPVVPTDQQHSGMTTPTNQPQNMASSTSLTPKVSSLSVASPTLAQPVMSSPQIPTQGDSPMVRPVRPPHSMPTDLPPNYPGFNPQMSNMYTAQAHPMQQHPNMPPQHQQYQMQPMAPQYAPRYGMPPHQKLGPQYGDQGFRPPGYHQPPPGMSQMPPVSAHMNIQQTMMARPRHPQNPSQAHGVPGMGYPPMHYPGARQSPVPSAMMNMPPSQGSQPIPRTSPVNRKTPPMMNLGQMTEVPYPSQASMPEETPIIRMTNMAAFPMGSEVTASTQPSRQRQAPTGKTTPTKSPMPLTTPSSGIGQTSYQSKSPVNLPPAQPANVSVIKSVKSPIVPPATSSVEGPALPSQEKLSPGRGGQAPAGTVTAVPSSSETSTPQPIIYYGYDSNETVPTDMCLVGCIFYMGEYIKTDPCDQWTKAIEQNGGTVDPSYSNRVTHVLVETQASDVCRLALNDHKRVVTAHWLNDVIGLRKMEPPWRAHHLPHPHQADKQLCSNQVIGITGFDRTERKILRVLTQMIGASFTSYLARSNTALVCKRLEGDKVKKAQEWEVPCVNVQWLSELVLGNLRALKLPIDDKYRIFGKADDFVIDPSMASVVMSGWRVPLKIPKDCWRKFKPNNKSADSSSTNKHKAEDEMFTNPTKRFRLQEIQNTRSNLPPGQNPYILLTGFTKSEKSKYSEMITRLGGVVSDEPSQCSHLIAEKIVRTPKFLTAINYCSFISSSEWIVESSKSGHFVDERVFTLQNSEAGSMWNILEALERRRNHGKPFTGLLFHITRGVPDSTLLPKRFLCQLILAAGGTIQPEDAKRYSVQKIINSQSPTHNDKPSYIVISCRDDIHLNMDMLNNGLDLYSVEFILSGVMNQQAAYESVLCIKEPRET